MGTYVSSTREEQLAMLKTLGYESYDELFAHIPDQVKIKEGLNLPEGLSEMEAQARMEELAAKNTVFPHIFRGAGSYNHYIPAAVKRRRM